MNAKLLMARCNRRPIRKHYPQAVTIHIWFNQSNMARQFITGALRKYANQESGGKMIEIHFSELTKRVRITFDEMEKEQRTSFQHWLKGYCYAKGWDIPMMNMIDQPKLDL